MDTVNIFIVVYVRMLSYNIVIDELGRIWKEYVVAYSKCFLRICIKLTLFGSIFEPGIYRKRVESDIAAVFCLVAY